LLSIFAKTNSKVDNYIFDAKLFKFFPVYSQNEYIIFTEDIPIICLGCIVFGFPPCASYVEIIFLLSWVAFQDLNSPAEISLIICAPAAVNFRQLDFERYPTEIKKFF